MLFDTHVNLHAEQFAGEVDDVIARARAAGVTRFVTICDRLDRYSAVKAIADANADIWCSVGVHPHYAKDFWTLEAEKRATPTAAVPSPRNRNHPALADEPCMATIIPPRYPATTEVTRPAWSRVVPVAPTGPWRRGRRRGPSSFRRLVVA